MQGTKYRIFDSNTTAGINGGGITVTGGENWAGDNFLWASETREKGRILMDASGLDASPEILADLAAKLAPLMDVGKAVVKCSWCGQWGARMCACKHCGQPID